MASYPNSIVSFGSKSAGQTIQPGHVNDLQDEVTAVETQLLTWTAYTPTWTNNGTANSLGDGSITGSYRKVGTQVFFRVTLTWGSTTSAGSSFWFLSVPVTAEGTFVFSGGCTGRVVDSNTGVGYAITCVTGNAGVIIPVYASVSGATVVQTVVTGSAPMTWAVGDTLHVQGWYIQA